MKNALIFLSVFAVIGTASAVLVTNGDFEDPVGTAEGWGFATGSGTPTEELTGGNPDGYVTIECPANMWGVWYMGVRENLAELGIPAGETVTYTIDIKNLSGNADSGGLKAESWDSSLDDGTPAPPDGGNPGFLNGSGDVYFSSTGNWASYSYDYTIAPTADQVQFVLLNATYASGSAAKYGYDNARITAGGRALRPVPFVGALFPDDSTTLSWENPDPNNPADTVTAAAYLLESDVPLNDPNLGPVVFEPGVQTLIVDAGQESADVTGLLTVDKYYYWAVHVTDSNGGSPVTTQGYTWDFYASGDSIPTADAGPDQYLVTEGTGMVLNLDATVTDDGTPTITWTDITDAGDIDQDTVVTINSAGTEDTTVTLTNGVSGVVNGWYQFQIEIDDGVNAPVTDQVAVGVYGTCAEAADADPDDDYDITGDLNLDCRKDIADFAIFAAGWLEQSDRYQP